MNVTAVSTMRQWQAEHADARAALETWFRAARAARWTSLHSVRRTFPTADQVECCLVFNIRGNHYRLICRVSYANAWSNGTLYLKQFLTHAEYDDERWRSDCEP